jgi:hypothetical protein
MNLWVKDPRLSAGLSTTLVLSILSLEVHRVLSGYKLRCRSDIGIANATAFRLCGKIRTPGQLWLH